VVPAVASGLPGNAEGRMWTESFTIAVACVSTRRIDG